MDIKKILLVHPPMSVNRIRSSYINSLTSFPLGLLYVASLLLENGYDVEILDCLIEGLFNVDKTNSEWFRIGLSENDIVRRVQNIKPDLVGISIPYSCQFYDALWVNKIIKAIDRRVITVAGGAHVTALPESIGADAFDYLITGEGEKTLLDLVSSLRSNSSAGIPGVFTQADIKGGHFSAPRFPINDLNSLPYPRYDLLKMKEYWRGRKRWVTMITSRGCPFDCNFCSIHSVMGFKLRLRSVDNIIIEIEELKKRFNLDEIWFEDDNLTGDIKRAKDLFRNIIDRDLGITFYARNGLRPDNLDNEMLTLMKKAGFKEIALAPESASQRTLDEIINKRLQLEDLERVIIMAKDTGLKTNCFLVIGFPEENLDDVKRTVEYGSKLRKLGSSLIFISCATPYPGTRLFSECIEKGIIDPEDFDFRKLSTFDSVIHNDFFSAADLAVMRSKAENKLNKFEKTRQNIFKIKYFFTEPIWFIKKAFYKIKLTILHKVKITKAI